MCTHIQRGTEIDRTFAIQYICMHHEAESHVYVQKFICIFVVYMCICRYTIHGMGMSYLKF